MQEFKEHIKSTIGTSDGTYRKNLARQIIQEKIPITGLIDLLFEEHPISTRFSWLLGDVIIQAPEKSKAILQTCFPLLNQVKIKHFDRSISKQALVCGHDIPSEIEGEVVTKLFDWLMDPQKSVSTKNNCLFALEHLCKKYPELKDEFLIVLKTQKSINTKDFEKRVDKVLFDMSKL